MSTPGNRTTIACPRRKGWNGGYISYLMVVIVLAVVILAAAAVGGLFIIKVGTDSGNLLAEGWVNTQQALEQRYSGGPLSAILAVLEQDTEASKLSVAVSDLEAAGQSLDGMLKLDIFRADGEQLAILANSTLLGVPLDAQIYYSKSFFGIGSKALLGSGTAYGATPGHFAEEARGSIFDPVTGSVPIDPVALMELDDAINGLEDTKNDEAASLSAILDALSVQYEDFVQSVKPKQSKGLVPSSGASATVLSYVYPSSKVIETLQVMGDTCWNSEYVSSYLAAADTVDGYDPDALKGEWSEMLAALKRNYTGDFTVRYYLADKAVAYLELSTEPTYDGDTARLDAYIDFGIGGDTLTASISSGDSADTFQISLTSMAAKGDDKMDSDWTLKCIRNGSSVLSIMGSSHWDQPCGALQFAIEANSYGAYAETLQLDASGSLTVNGAERFELALDKVEINDGYAPISFGLNLSFGSGAILPQPQSTQNIFKLTEDEFYQAYVSFLSAVMTLSS